MKSQHHTEVATEDEQLKEILCRDINTESEAVATAACKEIKVATSLSCRDIRCKDQKVAITSSGRDIKYKELRSRHQSDVATSVVKKRGRDMIKLSRHQLH